MSRKKPPPAPPLDWLRQSIWAGEELPDELDLLDEADAPPGSLPAPKLRRKPGSKTASKPRNRPK